MKVNVYHIIILVLLIVIIMQRCGHNNKLIEQANQYEAINDKLTYSLDSSRVTIGAIKGKQAEVIKKLKQSNDSLSNTLIQVIKDGKGKTITATIIKELIRYKTDSIPFMVIGYDTIFKDSIIEVRPRFESKYKDLWINYVATFDSSKFKLDLITYNMLKVTHKKRRGGIELIVQNESPYSLTTEAKSYVFDNKTTSSFQYGAQGHYNRHITYQSYGGSIYAAAQYKAFTLQAHAGIITIEAARFDPFAGVQIRAAFQKWQR